MEKRKILRILGPLFIVIGIIPTAIGLADFYSAFGSFGQPDKFWLIGLGFPLIFAGLAMTTFGYYGAAARYVAGEVAPVVTDTFNYVAEGASEGIVSRSIGEGLGEALGKKTVVRCHKCNQDNPSDAKFCSSCGAPLLKTKKCPSCGEMNDPDAKFCDSCGKPMS
jgi:ribosomal protein L40E